MATYECQVVQLREGDVSDDPMVNVLHLDIPGAQHSEGDADGIGALVLGLWDTDYDALAGGQALKAFQHSSTTLEQVRIYRAGEQGPPISVVLPATPIVGTGGSSTALPPQVAVSASFRVTSTSGPGKIGSRWGRMYLGNLSSDVNASSRVSVPVVDGIGLQLAAWRAQFPAGVEHVVFSRKDGTAHVINRYVVDDVFDVIRSRRHSNPSWRRVVDV